MHTPQQFIQRSPLAGGIQALNVEWNRRGYMFSPLHITLDETHRAKSRRSAKEHAHNVYHIIIFTEGQNYFQFRGRPCPMRPGALVLASPGEPHDFFVLRPGKAVYSEITFTYADAAGQPLAIPFHQLLSLYAGLDLPAAKTPVVLSAKKTKAAKAILAGILARLLTRAPAGKLECAREVLGLFALVIRECYLPHLNLKACAVNPVQRARDYIETNYPGRISIRELAGMAGMSAGYFFRAFKKQFGCAPIACQQKLRIEAAKTLLRSTSLRCKEIAAKTGYNDAYYFSKQFKKIAGLAPAIYRRRKTAGHSAP